MTQRRPKIACIPNGPYYLIHDGDPRAIPNLQRANGEPCATVTGVALCRCGASGNKPFCDGSHGAVGFTDKNTADPAANKRHDYVGKCITIHDNRAVCAHAGVCTDRLSSVFRMNAEPWIDPDGAQTAEMIATIEACPSGALSYSVDNVEHRDREREPMVTVVDNGPYTITGGVELVGQSLGDGASNEHFTLCRCGGSKNKPFCDGSHWSIGFKDAAG